MNLSAELLADADTGGFLIPEEFREDIYLTVAGWQPPGAYRELNAMYDWFWKHPSWWLWLFYHCFLFKRFRQRWEGRHQILLTEIEASKRAFMAAHPELTRGPA